MALLDVQRRGQQIGRLRIGMQVPARTPGKMRPIALETFRFTTASRHTADAIAALYGGSVKEWGKQWEVITDRKALEVVVPPRDQVITQWYEMWTGGGCQRRCDSQREIKSGGPCLCPHAEDPTDADEVDAAARERDRLSKLNPPQACARRTRINVQIPDLPGLGVFRLDTGSFYAAGEVLDAGDLMQAARDRNTFLPAMVRIDPRERIESGQTKKYPVPVLEVLVTLRQIVTGALEAGGIVAQLPPPPGQHPRALTAGSAAVAGPVEVPQQTAAATRPKDAQDVATRALNTTDPDEVDRLGIFARSQGWDEDMVETSPGVIEELRPFLEERWHALRQPQDGAA